MARYKVILAYDGTRFAGSQRQAVRRTVQGELEAALRRLGWPGRSVVMAGRTDTGVHAIGQVAAFDLAWPHGEDRLLQALNSALPEDVAVRQACVAPADFHPRFDARSRLYRYRLFCHSVRDPLHERLAWRVWPDVELERLSEAAAIFPGTHDFACFGSPVRSGGTTIRTVGSARWQETGGELTFEIRADAFLYRMVRRLVFLQVAAAQGRVTLEALARCLSRGAGRLPAGLAPAHGLTLVEVAY
jgi:tRNA pseudouridine38-40 synthase